MVLVCSFGWSYIDTLAVWLVHPVKRKTGWNGDSCAVERPDDEIKKWQGHLPLPFSVVLYAMNQANLNSEDCTQETMSGAIKRHAKCTAGVR